MSPAGLTAVAQSATLLKNRGWSPSTRFPDRSDVSHYLARMGFRRAMRGVGRCLAAPRGDRRFRASTALVELTKIRDTGDVEGLLDGLSETVAAFSRRS